MKRRWRVSRTLKVGSVVSTDVPVETYTKFMAEQKADELRKLSKLYRHMGSNVQSTFVVERIVR